MKTLKIQAFNISLSDYELGHTDFANLKPTSVVEVTSRVPITTLSSELENHNKTRIVLAKKLNRQTITDFKILTSN